MPSLTAPRPRVKPAPKPGVCRWVIRPRAEAGRPGRVGSLWINGGLYVLAELLDDAQAPVGWELRKTDAAGDTLAAYHLDTTQGAGPNYWACDCPDATYRDRACKHCRGLAAALNHLAADSN